MERPLSRRISPLIDHNKSTEWGHGSSQGFIEFRELFNIGNTSQVQRRSDHMKTRLEVGLQQSSSSGGLGGLQTSPLRHPGLLR